jgi:hypothetical protein
MINYKEGRFILAHMFGGFSLWTVGCIAYGTVVRCTTVGTWTEGNCLSHGGRKKREGVGIPIFPSRAHPQ